MHVNARTPLGIAVLAVACTALYAVFRPSAPGIAPTVFQSSTACRDCHAEVYAEWEGSWHARSWTDPDVRALSNDFANTDCIDCHAPRPVFETGVDQRVFPRVARRNEGVDCIACHALAGADEGRMAGTIERADARCRPRQMVELSRSEFCAPCHDQHQTVTEWLGTRYAAEGIGCVECHMPFRGGDPNRGRDHTMHGGHSIELVRSAVDLRARRQGTGVLVEVENVGAGHSFPTDERSRAADVFWRPVGEAEWRHLYRFRSPYRDEVGLTSTLLAAHETRAIELAHPAASDAIEVALFYKLTPYRTDPAHPDPDGEARLVERLEVAP
jgi:nitrate/TMAO reductase-like tetraheme cytochrome c subunit